MNVTVEQLEENMLYENAEQRDVVKQYFTNPQDMDRQRRTIIFSTPSETGTSYFRLFEPMRVLWKHFRDEANFVYTECIQPNHFRLGDCVIMHRAGNLHSHFVSVARMWPKTEKRPLIIHDVDDNEFNLPRTHPMAEIWYASKKDQMSLQSLKQSDLVCTTTEKLSRTFGNFNDNVHIFRNGFDWELPQWNYDIEDIRKEMVPEWMPTDDKIIIGWAGLTSHYEDLRRMKAVLKAIHDKYPNTYFVLAGMALRDSQVEIEYGEDGKPHFKEKVVDDDDQKYRGRVKNLYGDFDNDRIKIFDALPLEEYAKFYALFDISMAFVEHNAFASCKSEIKVVESLHYGCVPVFSLFGGYKDMWDIIPEKLRVPNMGISVMAPRIWINALEHWVQNMEEGKAAVRAIRSFTDNHYDLNRTAEERLNFYLQKIEDHEEEETHKVAAHSKEYYGD